MHETATKIRSSTGVSQFAKVLWFRVVACIPGREQSTPPKAVDSTFSEQIEENRLVRVPSYCVICASGWVFFSLFYTLRGAPHTALLCWTVAVILVGLCVLTIRKPARRRRCANLHLAVTFAGLTLESLVSGLSESSTLPFFCCIGVIAAHQSGIKIAAIWTFFSAGVVAALHFNFDASEWPQLRPANFIDDAMAFSGLFLLVTWMAAQAEWFATKYFRQLLSNANDLTHLAQHDQLTQLANRYRFRIELQEAKEAYHKTGMNIGLLMLDLDSFKNVNDTLGHLAGDAVLREVARRLEWLIDAEHTVCRIGGDEFTVIVRSATTEKLDGIAAAIIEGLAKPIRAAGRDLPMTASIGAAIMPAHTRCIDELQAYADLAVYAAKESDDPLAFYAPYMTEELTRKQTLVEKLAQAIDKREFSLVYQPQVESTGRIIGVEALLRWNHVDKSTIIEHASDQSPIESIAPADFVPILESTGQIIPVGRWVLEEACRQANVWFGMGIDCTVSVNVSPIQFRSADFVQEVLDVLHDTKIPPQLLDLEITEGVTVDRPEETRGKLQRLKDTGVKISVDDFGTGYSSLAYLKHLPIDRLKIDQIFVNEYPQFDDGSIATSIIGLAHSLSLTVVAEGIETAEQLSFLAKANCDTYQGYYFSKPVSALDCTKKLLAENMPGSAQGSGSRREVPGVSDVDFGDDSVPDSGRPLDLIGREP